MKTLRRRAYEIARRWANCSGPDARIRNRITHTGWHIWLRGYDTGRREARKRFEAQLKDAERRVREAEALAAAYKEERRKAIDEANRRAAIIQSRLPATNGGYG